MSISSSQNTAPITKIAPTQDLRARIHPQDGDVSANVTQPRQDDKTDVTLTTLTKKDSER